MRRFERKLHFGETYYLLFVAEKRIVVILLDIYIYISADYIWTNYKNVTKKLMRS